MMHFVISNAASVALTC